MVRISIAIALFLVPVLAGAQQQVFRYIDKNGSVVYTDSAPPPDARSVQQKRLGGNFIETSELPYALQAAQQRNPVTLYSGPCGTVCEQARALLNRRGIPHRDIDPSQPVEAERMQLITGDLQVPVLVIGGAALLKGFDEGSWQAALDQAGYPKTPASRFTARKRETEKAAADDANGKSDRKDETKAIAKGDARPAEPREANGEAGSVPASQTAK